MGKEDKQVKQHSYVTSLYLQYDNAVMSNWTEKVPTYMDDM